jgi:hypothetical protein
MTEQVPDIEVNVVVNNWNGLREKGIEGYRELLEKLRQPLDDIAVSYDIDMQSEEDLDAIKIGKPILDIVDQRININSVHRY